MAFEGDEIRQSVRQLRSEAGNGAQFAYGQYVAGFFDVVLKAGYLVVAE